MCTTVPGSIIRVRSYDKFVTSVLPEKCHTEFAEVSLQTAIHRFTLNSDQYRAENPM